MEYRSENGLSVPIQIQRRKGTRRVKLSLGLQNQIVASAPWHTKDWEVLRFIDQQRHWLDQQLTKTPPTRQLGEWLQKFPRLSASGDWFTVRIERATPNQRAHYTFAEGGSVILLRPGDGSESSLRALVRRLAKDALTCRVAYQAKRLGLRYSGLSVRDQSSRWGSCSTRRGISLNWRLLLLRPALQDYVILHELAHLTEMNHGPAFWALLDGYDPERRQHERDLKMLSGELMRVARRRV